MVPLLSVVNLVTASLSSSSLAMLAYKLLVPQGNAIVGNLVDVVNKRLENVDDIDSRNIVVVV